MRLANKVAIITGAGSGLGKASAILFAKEGADVVIADVSTDGGLKTQEEIQKLGKRGVFVKCDVVIEDEVRNAVERAIDSFGRIDILVNNAGVNASKDTITDLPMEEWHRVYNINVKGPFLFCRYVIPQMAKRKHGSIVNVSSNGAIYGTGGGHASRSSKASLLSFTRTLAIQYAPDNIRVNCLCPGAMDTPMRHLAAKERPVVSPTSVPLGRIADPMEIAYCVLFLASDESSYVTGATLIADGGRTAS